tara:strand:+ start:1166 stop:1558 length:393 start_codon:yes stop_codon:yes gene_type:complete
MEISNSDEKELINHFYEKSDELYSNITEKQINYVKRLINLYKDKREELDIIINQKLKNWDMSRLAMIDKLILRMSLTEMLYIDDVPPKVSIAEGVEIAKEFSTKDSSRFVNGILDAVYNDTKHINTKKVD